MGIDVDTPHPYCAAMMFFLSIREPGGATCKVHGWIDNAASEAALVSRWMGWIDGPDSEAVLDSRWVG